MTIGLRFLVVIGIVVGMPVASYFLVFKPQNKEISKAKEEISHKQDLLQKLRNETSRNVDLEKANLDIRRTVKAIEERLPSNQEIDGVVRQVSDLAIRCGLKPPAMKSGRPVPAALYMEQPIEMEVSGDFVGFNTFLAQIEKMPRITRIPDLRIEGQDKEDVELRAQFTLSIYFQDERQASESGSKP